MDFYYRAVQGHSLNPDADDLSTLQLLEQSVQNTDLGPAVHARIDRVPVAKPLWQTAPFAAMLRNVQDVIENLKIRKTDVPTLSRQTAFDLLVLVFGDFHHQNIPAF